MLKLKVALRAAGCTTLLVGPLRSLPARHGKRLTGSRSRLARAHLPIPRIMDSEDCSVDVGEKDPLAVEE